MGKGCTVSPDGSGN